MEKIYSTYQHQSKNFQPERLKTYKLAVFITKDLLAYAILSREDKILAVKEYRSRTNDLEVQDFFDAVREQDYFLKEEFSEVRIIAGIPEFSLIPGRYFRPEQMKMFAEAGMKDSFDLEHLSYRPLGHADAVAVFTIPFPLKRKCDFYFEDPEYLPICHPAVHMGVQLSEGSRNLILVNVIDQHVVITAIRDRRLQLCNSYPYDGPTDIVYFIQLVQDIMKLNGEACKVFITGNFETDSELIRQLRNYIPEMEVPGSELQETFDTLSDKLPTWKYAFMTY